jgi:NADPH:quinone reductase-like Zn-dependent oxidoreductase
VHAAMALRDGYGVDALTVVERGDLTPGPGQVVLRMQAVSLNYRDLLVVDGINRWRPSLPRIPVSDGVGLVIATGERVSRVREGDRVMPTFYPRWLEGPVASSKLGSPLGGAVADGVLSELVIIDESAVVCVPEYLSSEEAATLPCAAVTAWNAVMEATDITPGDSVVVLGTGGVALFAIQFAKLRGAHVIVTSSSDEKLGRVIGLGADTGVNYRSTPDWPGAVRDLTGGGADHVIDTAGDLSPALSAVRVGGTVAFVGLLTGMTSEVDLVTFMGKSARVTAVDVGSRAMFEAMTRAMATHRVRPVIDRVFPFTETRDAFRHLASRTHVGKVVVRFNGGTNRPRPRGSLSPSAIGRGAST